MKDFVVCPTIEITEKIYKEKSYKDIAKKIYDQSKKEEEEEEEVKINMGKIFFVF